MTRRHVSFLAALLVVAGLAAPRSRAADLPTAAYAGTAELGPVLLDGRYPLVVGESSPGAIEITTSPTGALSARVLFAGRAEDAVGKITVRPGRIRLVLRGKLDEGRIGVDATLRGGAFVGTVSLGGKSQPCRVEVATVAPLRAAFELTLTCAPNGRVGGAGTVTIARQEMPATARGSVRKRRLTLTVKAGRTVLQLVKGEFDDDGSVVVSRWRARGFGAVVVPSRPVRLVPR